MLIKEDLAIEMVMLASASRYLRGAWDHDHEGWTESELNGFLTLLNYVCAEVQDLRNHVNGAVSGELAPAAETILSGGEVETRELVTAA